MADTVLELGYTDPDNQTARVRDKLILSDNLGDPEVANASTEREALTVLKRKVTREFLAKLASMSVKVSCHTLELADAVEGMQKLETGSIDVVITDPPYGVGADKAPFGGTKEKHTYTDSWPETATLLKAVAKESIRVTKPDAHMYVFCDIRKFADVAAIFYAAGWTIWPRPFIWVKDTGMSPSGNYGPQHVYECVLYALKGDKPLATTGGTDVIQVPSVKGKVHAAQKPVDLYVNLLRRSVSPGDVILDPLCGAGTVFKAATTLGVRAIGFDNDAAAVGLSREAIGDEQMPSV